ncbi:MAG TPA: hypothetical protein VGG21_06550 [Acidimicrobiales bacterium]|jgi:hypothetical protein
MTHVESGHLPRQSAFEVATAEERPDLWEVARTLFLDVWPEYNIHGNDTPQYFGSLFPQHAALQILVVERATGDIVARGRTIPFRWDGTDADLPRGIDAVGLRAISDQDPPTALSALAAEVSREHQGTGLSSLIIASMGDVARRAGLKSLVAPVRPNWKDRYPITPIDQYARWTRSDGLPFDPWLRVHARLGGVIVRSEPESLRIEASVSEWETWTQIEFPEDGTYVFPGGLAPLRVKDDVGLYWEPNVWVRHEL